MDKSHTPSLPNLQQPEVDPHVVCPLVSSPNQNLSFYDLYINYYSNLNHPLIISDQPNQLNQPDHFNQALMISDQLNHANKPEKETQQPSIKDKEKASILQKILQKSGFSNPKPVQAQSLIQALLGKNLIIEGQSGSGKTLCYLTLMLAKLKPQLDKIQAVIILPTKELVHQVAAVLRLLNSSQPELKNQFKIGVLCDDHINFHKQENLQKTLLFQNDVLIATLNKFNQAVFPSFQEISYRECEFKEFENENGENGEKGEEIQEICTNQRREEIVKAQIQEKQRKLQYQLNVRKVQEFQDQQLQFLRLVVLDECDMMFYQQQKQYLKFIKVVQGQRRQRPIQNMFLSATFNEQLKNDIQKQFSPVIRIIQVQNQEESQKLEENELNFGVLNFSQTSQNIHKFTLNLKPRKNDQNDLQKPNLKNDISQYLQKVQDQPLLTQKLNRILLLLTSPDLPLQSYNQILIFHNKKEEALQIYNFFIKNSEKLQILEPQKYEKIVLFNNNLLQKQRLQNINKIKRNKVKLIISTDILSRGFDSNYIDIIFNLNLPNSIYTFQHRIGRTARNSNTGICFIFEEDIINLQKQQFGNSGNSALNSQNQKYLKTQDIKKENLKKNFQKIVQNEFLKFDFEQEIKTHQMKGERQRLDQGKRKEEKLEQRQEKGIGQGQFQGKNHRLKQGQEHGLEQGQEHGLEQGQEQGQEREGSFYLREQQQQQQLQSDFKEIVENLRRQKERLKREWQEDLEKNIKKEIIQGSSGLCFLDNGISHKKVFRWQDSCGMKGKEEQKNVQKGFKFFREENQCELWQQALQEELDNNQLERNQGESHQNLLLANELENLDLDDISIDSQDVYDIEQEYLNDNLHQKNSTKSQNYQQIREQETKQIQQNLQIIVLNDKDEFKKIIPNAQKKQYVYEENIEESVLHKRNQSFADFLEIKYQQNYI